MLVSAREPFSWAHSLAFLESFPPASGEQVVEGERLVKPWRLAGRTVVTAVSPAAGGLEVEVAGATGATGDEVLAAVADRVSFYLSLDDDLVAFDRTARDDPAFAPVAARLHGYHQVKFASPLENLVWSILAQRNPMAVARENKLRLMRALNRPVEAFGGRFLPFPDLAQLADLTEGDLAELVRNERKAGYLAGTIERLRDVDEAYLRHGDPEQVRATLLSLPGIGPWSADFVLIRGLGRMAGVPVDAEMLRAARKVYGPGVTEADLPGLASRYAPNQGYWAHYLRAAG